MHWNKKLLLTCLILSAIVIFKLALAAIEYNNWRGFYFSTFHVLLVATGSYLALRTKENV